MFVDFNIMTEELAGVEKLKNDFIANVSHKVKTPLSIIMNAAAILKKSELSDRERQGSAVSIITASKRLTSLITNIFRLNKLENQEIVAAAKPYNLGEQLRRTAADMRYCVYDLWEEKGLVLIADIDDDIRVCCDPVMLEITWSNAVKFTDPGGTVELSLRQENGRAAVTVSDTGCGMPFLLLKSCLRVREMTHTLTVTQVIFVHTELAEMRLRSCRIIFYEDRNKLIC